MSDLGKALITLGLDVRITLLKICVVLISLSTILEVMELLVSSKR